MDEENNFSITNRNTDQNLHSVREFCQGQGKFPLCKSHLQAGYAIKQLKILQFERNAIKKTGQC